MRHSLIIPQFRRALLTWYRRNRRDLPWRRTRDPYHIWVSEIMLQQTVVATVIPYYERFLKTFPTIRSLAESKEEAVLARWSGLGYYRRAKLLHQGAQFLQGEFRGQLPTHAVDLAKIPGIGPYTAGAIASIAFGEPSSLVDGNVIRVFSRIFGLKGHAKSGELKKQVWGKASQLLDPKYPGDFNQALMELGAMICRPTQPACEQCPVADSCRARQAGRPEAFPESPPQKKTAALHRIVALCRQGDRVLLVKKESTRWFQGMWELPQDYRDSPVSDSSPLVGWLRRQLGITVKTMLPLPDTHHSVTHHRIVTQAWMGEVSARLRLQKPYISGEFTELSRIGELPLPNLDRKVLQAAGLLESKKEAKFRTTFRGRTTDNNPCEMLTVGGKPRGSQGGRKRDE